MGPLDQTKEHSLPAVLFCLIQSKELELLYKGMQHFAVPVGP